MALGGFRWRRKPLGNSPENGASVGIDRSLDGLTPRCCGPGSRPGTTRAPRPGSSHLSWPLTTRPRSSILPGRGCSAPLPNGNLFQDMSGSAVTQALALVRCSTAARARPRRGRRPPRTWPPRPRRRSRWPSLPPRSSPAGFRGRADRCVDHGCRVGRVSQRWVIQARRMRLRTAMIASAGRRTRRSPSPGVCSSVAAG